MEKILLLKKLILEFENDSQVNKFIVYLAKTFLKYVVTIAICNCLFVCCIIITMLLIQNENIRALFEVISFYLIFVGIYFAPSIVFILLFSRDKLTFHPFIFTLIPNLAAIINHGFTCIPLYIFFFSIICSFIITGIHFCLLKLLKLFFQKVSNSR